MSEFDRMKAQKEALLAKERNASLADLRARVAGLEAELAAEKAGADALAEALEHMRWCSSCAEAGWDAAHASRRGPGSEK